MARLRATDRRRSGRDHRRHDFLCIQRRLRGLVAALHRGTRTLLRPPIIVVGALDVIADGAFLAAATAALAPAAVVTSLYPAVTLLLNRSILRERLHTVHMCGVVAALFSVACLAR